MIHITGNKPKAAAFLRDLLAVMERHGVDQTGIETQTGDDELMIAGRVDDEWGVRSTSNLNRPEISYYIRETLAHLEGEA